MKHIYHTLPLIVMLACSVPAAHAAEAPPPHALAAADASGGYSGRVLNKISRLWTPPPDNLNRRVSVRLRIDGEGQLQQCDPMTPSDLPEMNKSACAAAREAGNFGPPPYGLGIDVFVTFWTGRPSKSALGAKDPVTTPAAPGPSQVSEKLQAEKAAQPTAPKAATPARSDAQKPAPRTPEAMPKGKPEARDAKDAKTVRDARAGQSLSGEATPKSRKQDNPDAASVPLKSVPAATPGKAEENRAQGKTAPPQASVKAEVPKPQGRKVEPVKTEVPKAEAPKPQGRKVEPVKTEVPKAEVPKPQGRKVEPVKPEAPKAETPKPEPAKPVPAATAPARTASAPPPPQPGQPQGKVVPGTPMSRYMDDIVFMVRPRIIPPARTPSGKYTVGIVLSVDNRGQVTGTRLERSSGQAALDDAVLLAVTKVGKLSAPPDKQAHNLNLTFTVQKP